MVFAKRVRISEELKGGNAAVASESAELGVGEHLALDNIIQKHRTSWYLRPSFCCGGSDLLCPTLIITPLPTRDNHYVDIFDNSERLFFSSFIMEASNQPAPTRVAKIKRTDNTKY